MSKPASELYSLINAAYYANDLKSLPELLEEYRKLTSRPHEVEGWIEERKIPLEKAKKLPVQKIRRTGH